MKSCSIRLSVLAALIGLAPAASAVTFEWVTVGDPGNACDDNGPGRCFGAVDHSYRIATREVTNAQYVEFLNAKAASDPLGLYNTGMATSFGGITRSGSDGSYTYSAVSGRENMPVNRVSFFDALRFVNWLHNGQGNGDTETGAYTLLGGTPTPSNPMVQRNPEATFWLPTDEEWYKAAHYDTSSATYFDYPTGTDDLIVCSDPTATSNTANCGRVVGGWPGDLTVVGSYTGSLSPNGTFDQGGNVAEWTDGDVGVLENRTIRGGSFVSPADRLRGEIQDYDDPWHEDALLGFRVATVADGAVCGDAVCEGAETPITCPADCPDVCGDGLCSGSEDLSSCPGDCACTTDADCDDGVFCNGHESCSDGACQAGTPIDCDDSVGCTIDSCNESAGTCDNVALDAACEDVYFCNGDEWCDPILDCRPGTPIECDDGVSCTTDVCYESVDMCMYIPDDSVCDNGVFCDGAEICDPDFDCQPGSEPCDSGETCDESSDTCEGGCQPRWGPCSKNSDCCSNRCMKFWGVCR